MKRGTVLMLSYAEADVIDKYFMHRAPPITVPTMIDLNNGSVADLRVSKLPLEWKGAYVQSLDARLLDQVCKQIPHTDVELFDPRYGGAVYRREMYVAIHPNVAKLVDIIHGNRVAELSDLLDAANRRVNEAERTTRELNKLFKTLREAPWYKRVWYALRGWKA